MNKKAVAGVLIILFLLIGCFLAFLKGRKADDITLYGNIEIRQSDLAFRVKGRLSELYKEEGDEVKEGELLAEIDSDTYTAELNFAKSDVKEKRALKLQKAADYKFNYPLCADFTVSKEFCSNLKYDAENAQGAYEASVANLEKAIINLDDTKLYAPYDGIILSRIREKGTVLDTNDVVYSISMKEPVWIRAYIDEKKLGRLKLGQRALVYTDSAPKKPYEAHIGFISPVAEFTPKTVETVTLRTDLVYRLRIIVDNTDLYLRQGMPCTVKVLKDE